MLWNEALYNTINRKIVVEHTRILRGGVNQYLQKLNP